MIRNVFKFDVENFILIERYLLPADIILFVSKNKKIEPVSMFQSKIGYPPESYKSNHVALYIGEGEVIHSNPFWHTTGGGVKIQSFQEATDQKDVVILRINSEKYPNFTKIEDKIVSYARSKLNIRYDYSMIRRMSIVMLQLSTIGIRSDYIEQTYEYLIRIFRSADDDIEGYICSDFIFDCYDAILREQNPLLTEQSLYGPAILPADFYMNEDLDDAILIDKRLYFPSKRQSQSPQK